MNKRTMTTPADWEVQINALLDGELSTDERTALQAEASRSPQLQLELQQALAVQAALHKLPGQEAPANLREKLRQIGQRQQPAAPQIWWRWAAAVAVIPLLFMLGSGDQPSTPATSEIEQGRRDLAVALKYLDQAGRRAAREIDTSINGAAIGTIREHTVQALTSQLDNQEEILL
jgi:anti-sigma factor RsiW